MFWEPLLLFSCFNCLSVHLSLHTWPMLSAKFNTREDTVWTHRCPGGLVFNKTNSVHDRVADKKSRSSRSSKKECWKLEKYFFSLSFYDEWVQCKHACTFWCNLCLCFFFSCLCLCLCSCLCHASCQAVGSPDGPSDGLTVLPTVWLSVKCFILV